MAVIHSEADRERHTKRMCARTHTHTRTHYPSLPNQTAIIWQTAMPIKATSGTMPFVHTRCSDIKPGVIGEEVEGVSRL